MRAMKGTTASLASSLEHARGKGKRTLRNRRRSSSDRPGTPDILGTIPTRPPAAIAMETASMRHKRPRLYAGILCLSGLALLGAGRSAAANDRGPGTYLSPLVPLQRLDGENTHLHVDEVRIRPDGLLLRCSYTFGVIDARRAGAMRYLAQSLRHVIPGDERRPGCLHLAWDGDVVYTTHRGNIRNPAFVTAWDI